MTDIAVTIPRDRWPEFITGPCGAGVARSYTIYGDQPPLIAGDHLYFVAHDRVRCAIEVDRVAFARGGHIVIGWFCPALTVRDAIAGFRGWRRVNFTRADLLAFDGWQGEGVSVHRSRNADPAAGLPPYAHGKSRSEQGGSSA